jgi:TRAP transporter TAXI family solute receptor
MPSRYERLLSERLRETRSQLRGLWLKLWGGGFLVVVAGFAIAWFLMEPAPPRTVVIVSGAEDGAYYHFAELYAEHLAQQGIRLEVRSTAGSIQNYELLHSDPTVDLAIVQGGTAPEEALSAGDIESIASLYLEPFWVFYRSEQVLSDLRDLQNRRIAIGADGSGTQAMARLMLAENGVDPASDDFVAVGGAEASGRLQSGTVDAACFVMSPDAPIIRTLLESDGIHLLSFQRHAAYARRHPFLNDVTLYRGVIDFERDVPAEDVFLVAPAANLVADRELHDALVPLLLRAATQTHEPGSSLVRAGRFPSTEFIEFPLNESARRYFESGPPLLQKYLPFWVASAIDRGKVLLLPAFTLLLPLLKIAPPVYRWRIRSRIYRWYELLRRIERDLREGVDKDTLDRHVKTLSEMQRELDELASVPLAYMEEFYNLRLHVEFVERRVRKAMDASVDSRKRLEQQSS